MYDKSKAEMLEYIKKKDDEIKALNDRIDLLEEDVDSNTEDIKEVSEKYTHAYWGIKGTERDIADLVNESFHMKRRLNVNTGLVIVQPVLWGICWALISWLMK